MPKTIFINLPVADVAKATAFYEALGFKMNPAFSNESASAMGWSDTIHIMLLDRAFYATFTDKQIIDAKTHSGALLCLSFDSKEAVDDIHSRAATAGGRETRAIEDKSFMYGGAFEDLDGHGWETVWMDAGASTDGATLAHDAA
ncbi:VOC family protein [Sulfitobacter sp. NFXS29]|uniref:VOC family protein n=1 Tax=Sulfitobacter sp. NFXS29 TaxID=2818438 RepID=UPI0032DFC351|tara:strand:- start:1128 stop:1559 length:432 start_codon:yes stop_codon:yes gene_type:complete